MNTYRPDETDATPREAENRRPLARPDQLGPRGNQEADRADVERGLDQLDRVLAK